jgi:putative membrane protein
MAIGQCRIFTMWTRTGINIAIKNGTRIFMPGYGSVHRHFRHTIQEGARTLNRTKMMSNSDSCRRIEMKKIFAFSVMAFLIGWSGASAGQAVSIATPSDPSATKNGSPPSSIDMSAANSATFLANAFHDSILEVAMAQLALRNSSNAEITRFAEKTIVEHIETNDQIRKLAQSRNIVLPSQLPADHRKMLENLSTLSDNEFDLTYLHHELMMHELQMRRLSEWANAGNDPDIRNFAANTLHGLQAHLQAARGINRRTHPAA